MTTFIVKVSDSITYTRQATLLIEAEDETAAEMLAHARCISNVDIQWDEDETDNTPYEVEIVDDPEAAASLGALVLADATRPAGLDGDERQELELLMTEHDIEPGELKVFVK